MSGSNKKRYRKPESVKALETLYFEAKKANYVKRNPGINPYFLVGEKFRDNTANGLTKCIIEFIKLSGGQAERINTTGRVLSSKKEVENIGGAIRSIGSTKWIPGTSTKGSADISATICGRSVKVEVKIGKDRQSDDQIAYQHNVENAGGLYFVARNFDDFLAWFNDKFGENEC